VQRFGFHSARYICIIAGVSLFLTLGGCATNFHGAYRFAGPEQPPAAVSLTNPASLPSATVDLVAKPRATLAASPATPSEPVEQLIPHDDFEPEATVESIAPVSVGGPPPVVGSEPPVTADVTGAGGSWVTSLYEWLQPWVFDASSPEALMGEMTASAALYLIRGLSLSPAVQIVSMTAVVLARPLIRAFFEWLGGSRNDAVLAAVEPAPAPVIASKPVPEVARIDQPEPEVSSIRKSAGPSRIGCCEVH
jgi:hypothetical protein